MFYLSLIYLKKKRTLRNWEELRFNELDKFNDIDARLMLGTKFSWAKCCLSAFYFVKTANNFTNANRVNVPILATILWGK